MELNIPERIAILSILPVEGSIITLRVLNELRNDLAFTEQELKDYKIKNTEAPQGGAIVTWDIEQTNTKKNIKIGESAEGIIAKRLRELESQQKLHVSMVPLYERFVEGKK